MNHSRLIDPIFDLARFGFIYGGLHIKRNRARLGIRHQTARPQHLPESTHQTHHVGCRDDRIKTQPSALDLIDHVFTADKIGAGVFSFLDLLALRYHQDRL